ncbi:MAG: hypothetical protein RLO52_11815 [Sandaracinaceae bacterium]
MAQQRPGMLTAVAIIAIVIGVLGSCVSSFTFASTLAQGPLNEFNRANLESMQGANPEMLQRQLETQDRLQEIAESWQPFTLTHQVLNLFASLALGIAGILLLRWKPMALGLFVGAAAASIFVDVIGTVLGIVVQLQMKPIMREMMAGAAEAAPGMGDTMGAVGEASASVGMCMGALFLVVKVAYYVWGIVVVRKDAIRSLFAAQSAAQSAGQ